MNFNPILNFVTMMLNKNITAVKSLISEGFDVDARFWKENNTMSMIALKYTDMNILDLLIENGANVLLTNNENQTINDMFCEDALKNVWGAAFEQEVLNSPSIKFEKYYTHDKQGNEILTPNGIIKEACRLGTVKFIQQIHEVTNSSPPVSITESPDVSDILSTMTDYIEEVTSSTMSALNEAISGRSFYSSEGEGNLDSTTPIGNLTQEMSSNSLEGVAPLVIAVGVVAAASAAVGLVWWGCSYLRKPVNNYDTYSNSEAEKLKSLS